MVEIYVQKNKWLKEQILELIKKALKERDV